MALTEAGPKDHGTLARTWGDAAGVAAIAFLSLMVVATVLLVAGKLQFSSLGSGASPIDVLRAIGLVALACLGVTIDIDDLPLSVLPLGALAIAAFMAYRLSRPALRSRFRHPLVDGFRIGLPFGVFCTIGAAVFRFGGDVPVAASAVEGLVIGFVWGSLFGALASACASRGFRALVRAGSGRIPPSLRGGVLAGGAMSGLAFYGGVVGLLCLSIGRLVTSELPRGFGAGDALAALLYLAAFLPNAVVAVFSLAMGGSLTVGAQVEVNGQTIGPLRELSLTGEGSGSAALLLLFAVPLITMMVAGAWLHRREPDRMDLARSIALGTVVFAIGVAVLAAIGDARLGGGLVRKEGVGLVAVDATTAGSLALAWGFFGTALGAVIDSGRSTAKKGFRR